MKVAAIVSIATLFFTAVLVGVLYFSPKFLSAFEADQRCHSDLKISFAQDEKFGCDHDLETRQWLLFEDHLDEKPAKVLKRYRY
ncbi:MULTISPECIES: hypothetical protein [Prochlorococcus]|uniref:hypothetical protein n=1 Tax=Prochlorococcus TaxID=1218 RepID=UPI000533953C|nr:MULTISPECIES: hypothetical protein [Prochlorococcus]KGG11961.1 hypothetical protein EV05_1163 [Prochlorococcus sp. MIT 0601]